MYCPSCGSALSRQMKYCTRCGAQTNMKEVGQAEKRFDEYLERLFWVADVGALEPSRVPTKCSRRKGLRRAYRLKALLRTLLARSNRRPASMPQINEVRRKA
jgi:hypothetical protein